MIQSQFSEEKIFSNSNEAFSLYEKSRFGEKFREKIEYSFVEALYLVQAGKMDVFTGKKKLDFDSLISKIKRKDRRIELKYVVYNNLRFRGYIVKTALKFGADFRVYDKGIKPGTDHALWILFVVKENEILKWHEFAAKNRVAHSTKKKLLIAVVDEESDVSFYEVDWKRM